MEINDYDIFIIRTVSSDIINYCYIIVDKATNRAAIIDPSWELTKFTQIVNSLKLIVDQILLTHSHNDHVNLVSTLIEKFNPLVYMSKTEIDYYNFKCKNLQGLNDNEVLQLGKTEYSCLLTPGHTVGSMCYLFKDSFFTGDTLFIEGCGYCDSAGSSPNDMFFSINRIKKTVSDKVKVFPAHRFGAPVGQSMLYVRKNNIYFIFDNVDQFVLFRMREVNKSSIHYL